MVKHAKAILFLVGLSTSFLVADRSISFLLNQVVRKSEFRYAKLYHSHLNADILVLGNSRGVNGFFAPSMETELGESVFNLSLNGLDIDLLGNALKDYCERNAAPKMVILEITSLHSDDAIGGLRFLMSDSPRMDKLLKDANYRDWILCNACTVYQYNTELFLRVIYFLSKSDQGWINDGVVDPEVARNWKVSTKEKELWNEPTGKKVKGLLELVRFADQEKIPVKLVIGPYMRGYTDQFDNYQRWKSAVQDAVGPDHPIYDFSNAIENELNFADMVHLNRQGSIEFFHQLREAGFFVRPSIDRLNERVN